MKRLCSKCDKVTSLVKYRLDGVVGPVCSWCRLQWRFENEPGFRDRYLKNQQDRNEKRKASSAVYKAKWFQDHKNQIKDRYRSDVNYRLSLVLRSRLRYALQEAQKPASAVRDLGCSIPELKTHLEARFQPGMTWGNWSLHGWHIDHIKPLAAFDLTDRQQFLQACHYTNLQPLWAPDNIRKGDNGK